MNRRRRLGYVSVFLGIALILLIAWSLHRKPEDPELVRCMQVGAELRDKMQKLTMELSDAPTNTEIVRIFEAHLAREGKPAFQTKTGDAMFFLSTDTKRWIENTESTRGPSVLGVAVFTAPEKSYIVVIDTDAHSNVRPSREKAAMCAGLWSPDASPGIGSRPGADTKP